MSHEQICEAGQLIGWLITIEGGKKGECHNCHLIPSRKWWSKEVLGEINQKKTVKEIKKS